MEYGIWTLGAIPVFKNPGLESEISSQLLFGETFEVIEQRGVLARIRSSYDQHEGIFSETEEQYTHRLTAIRRISEII